jgi:hypothetical protein
MNKLKAAALVELRSDPLQGRSGPTKAGDLHKQSEHVKGVARGCLMRNAYTPRMIT